MLQIRNCILKSNFSHKNRNISKLSITEREEKKTKFEGFVFNPYFLPKKIEKGPPIFGCNFHGPDGSTEGIGARKNDKSSLMNQGPYIHLEPHVCCAALRALTGHTRKTLLR